MVSRFDDLGLREVERRCGFSTNKVAGVGGHQVYSVAICETTLTAKVEGRSNENGSRVGASGE